MNYLSEEIDQKLENLDISLFQSIESQTSAHDKKSLLSIQNEIRKKGKYVFLEIGSHLGGTIQPYYLDPLCVKIFSIDKRSLNIPDERGIKIVYEGNSTERMLNNLKIISEENIGKVFCIDSDAEQVDLRLVDRKPDICFIDGEHTDEAVVKDFNFCFKLINKEGIIVFHDVKVVYAGIQSILRRLAKEKVKFRHYFLPSSIYVLELGDITIKSGSTISEILRNNSKSHIMLLKESFFYKRPKLSNYIVKIKSFFK